MNLLSKVVLQPIVTTIIILIIIYDKIKANFAVFCSSNRSSQANQKGILHTQSKRYKIN